MNPHLPSRCEEVEIRGLRYNFRHWGSPDAPRMFLLHGWMDTSATFQFVVDALAQEWHVIAPDWRGYGDSEWLRRPYWFPDYYADLDALLAHYSPDRPARLIGHSMGGSIAGIYAAIRPQRVAQLVMVDFLGLPAATLDEAPRKLDEWLDAVKGTPRLNSYPDHDSLAARLMQRNPRLPAERAAFLARNVGRRRSDGRIEMACDPWHKVPAPVPYRIDEVMTCWRQIACPVLVAVSDQGYVQQRFGHLHEEYQRRLGCFSNRQVTSIADCGHNVQHDQPAQLAAAIERFLSRD